MFYSNIDPVLLQLGPLSIRYYGVLFAIGIVLTFVVLRSLARKRGLPLQPKDFDELLLFGAIAVLVGGRLGHVISSFAYYSHNPLQVFAVWQGGMAFHGGLIGAVIAGLWFSRKKKISFYDLADIAVIPASLALALGRVANFINGEFYGTVTSLPFGVKFPGVSGFRHPVQVYEAFKNLFIFAVLWQLASVRKWKLPKGFLFWLFILLYGLLRFWLEFYKDVPEFAFGFTWGQVWGIPMVVVGAFMLFRLSKRIAVVKDEKAEQNAKMNSIPE